MEPLIYTTKGNLPVSQLRFKHYWEDRLHLNVVPVSTDNGMSLSVEKDGEIAYIEEYYLPDTDELVKRSVAIYRFKGLDMASDKANFI